jgi:hypothetical protein
VSHEEIVRRARRLPSDPRDAAEARQERYVLPPGGGTSIHVLPWWRRAVARVRGWAR